MGKITIKEFWETDEELVIHCNTKEQAITLLTEFDKLGKRWFSGESYLNYNFYTEYTTDIYYSNHNTFSYRKNNWSHKKNVKFYEFEDIVLN